jgi:hypothetical protein
LQRGGLLFRARVGDAEHAASGVQQGAGIDEALGGAGKVEDRTRPVQELVEEPRRRASDRRALGVGEVR